MSPGALAPPPSSCQPSTSLFSIACGVPRFPHARTHAVTKLYIPRRVAFYTRYLSPSPGLHSVNGIPSASARQYRRTSFVGSSLASRLVLRLRESIRTMLPLNLKIPLNLNIIWRRPASSQALLFALILYPTGAARNSSPPHLIPYVHPASCVFSSAVSISSACILSIGSTSLSLSQAHLSSSNGTNSDINAYCR
ncbi:hypothetical protein K438DRAFT_1956365 [Mycena galopus ATCC 62051]|nr:hypothetical protein K438DRAFT_1956365 [Mycena galopus ATCC 62051]